MLSFKKSFLTFASATAVVLGSTGYVIAQDQANTPNQTQQTQANTQENTETQMELTDAKIDAFADTAIEVVQIQQEMVPQINEAADEAQKQELFQDMQKQMMGTVESAEGITVAEYNAISQAAQENPELASKIETKIQGKAAAE